MRTDGKYFIYKRDGFWQVWALPRVSPGTPAFYIRRPKIQCQQFETAKEYVYRRVG